MTPLLCLCLLAAAVKGAAVPAPEPPRVFLVNRKALAETRRRVAAGDKGLEPAVERLRRDADRQLELGPWSVMDKKVVPPSGDKHDYMSVGPYWWPDPRKPDGLPYVRRDGEVNPERHDYDNVGLGKMAGAVETLALAFYLTDHEPYAARAATLLRVWFLDEATRMNPHLTYGQAIPGRCTGRGIGIIDTTRLVRLADAAGMLAGAEAWADADQRGLHDWFRRYLGWLRTSRHGKAEARTTNNHGTWYDVQAAAFALFVGEEDIARRVLEEAKARRIAAQIQPDGRQPRELARTKSWDYSTMNLKGMFDLATLGDRVGVDLWRFETADGRSIRKALDFLVPVAAGTQTWRHKQIKALEPERLASLLRRAAIAYDEPRYEALLRGVLGGRLAADRLRLLHPTP